MARIQRRFQVLDPQEVGFEGTYEIEVWHGWRAIATIQGMTEDSRPLEIVICREQVCQLASGVFRVLEKNLQGRYCILEMIENGSVGPDNRVYVTWLLDTEATAMPTREDA